MNRSELIRRMVPHAICDDYEDLDRVILREADLQLALIFLFKASSDAAST